MIYQLYQWRQSQLLFIISNSFVSFFLFCRYDFIFIFFVYKINFNCAINVFALRRCAYKRAVTLLWYWKKNQCCRLNACATHYFIIIAILMIGTRRKINVIIVIKFNYIAKTEKTKRRKKNDAFHIKYNLIDSKNAYIMKQFCRSQTSDQKQLLKKSIAHFFFKNTTTRTIYRI